MPTYKIYQIKRTLPDGGLMYYFEAENGKRRTAGNVIDLADEIIKAEYQTKKDLEKTVLCIHATPFKERMLEGCEEETISSISDENTHKKLFKEYYAEALEKRKKELQ